MDKLMVHQAKCPKCGIRASKRFSPLWELWGDLTMSLEFFAFVFGLLLFVIGKFWFIFALVAGGLLVWAEINRPKKYFCQACKYKFIFQPNKIKQPNNALHADTNYQSG